MKHRSFYCLVSFVVALGIIGCGKTQQEKKVILRVGSEKVTLNDIKQQLANTPMSYQEYLVTESGRKQLFDILTRQKLIIAVAKKKNIQKRANIKKAVDEFKNDYANKIKQYEDEMIMEEFLKELEESDLKVTDHEINDYYLQHQKEFKQPREFSISHILFSTDKNALDAIARIKAGESFEKVAKELSLDPASKERGGELGKFKFYELLPEFAEPIESAPVGTIIQKPVSTSYGYHVLKKTGERLLPSKPFEEAKADIKKLIVKKKFDKWMEDQKKAIKIQINDKALSSLWK